MSIGLVGSSGSTNSVAHSTSDSASKQFSVGSADAQHAINVGVQNTAGSAKHDLNKGDGGSAGKHTTSQANETPKQQKSRESAEAAKTHDAQQTREAAEHEQTKRQQKEREDSEHKSASPGNHSTAATASAAGTASTDQAQSGGTSQRAVLKSNNSTNPASQSASKSANDSANQVASKTTNAASVEQGKRSSLPAYSLDKPNLPAEKVKSYINDSVDRNWDQIRSSFNFSNDAKGKNEAKAFFQGAASRESATGETLRTNLVTGDGSAHSKGPLQTADTAYANNGHPEWNKDSHVPGIKQADLKDSNDLSTAIDMGIRHMSEGAELGKLAGHNSKEQAKLDGMAFHNTGHIDAATQPSWIKDYANETLKMANWYNQGDRTTSKDVVYTGQLK